jgi:DNA-binding NarL/FixJ family response regulator
MAALTHTATFDHSDGLAGDYPILIIDDHELFATALTRALRGEGLPACQVRIGGPVQILAAAAVLDLHLGVDSDGRGIDGAELVAPLRAHGWRVLIVSGSNDAAREAAAIAVDALGSVPKSSSYAALLATVRAAAAGER